MGGFIATESVITEPGRFSSLTLVSAAGISFAGMKRADKTAREVLLRVGLPIFERRVEANLGRKRLRAASFAGVIAHPSRISREILWELSYYGASAPALLESARALVSYDTRERLPEIEIPTLVVWGRRDRLVRSVRRILTGASSSAPIINFRPHGPAGAARPLQQDRRGVRRRQGRLTGGKVATPGPAADSATGPGRRLNQTWLSFVYFLTCALSLPTLIA
jgi:pimeloyl-ACP methyl ester carboxylesterase